MESSENLLEGIVAAIAQNDSSSLEHFLKSAGNSNASLRGRGLLHWCAQESSVDCAALLLDWGARIDECDGEGHFPLFQAAAEGSLDFVQFLIERGAPLDQCTAAGTALGIACAYERVDVVRFLRARGADLSLPDAEGATPVSISVEYSSSELIAALLGEPERTED